MQDTGILRGEAHEGDVHRQLWRQRSPQLGDMPDPVPAAGEIVVRVRAAGVNPVDWKICKGQMWPLVRLHFPTFLAATSLAKW